MLHLFTSNKEKKWQSKKFIKIKLVLLLVYILGEKESVLNKLLKSLCVCSASALTDVPLGGEGGLVRRFIHRVVTPVCKTTWVNSAKLFGMVLHALFKLAAGSLIINYWQLPSYLTGASIPEAKAQMKQWKKSDLWFDPRSPNLFLKYYWDHFMLQFLLKISDAVGLPQAQDYWGKKKISNG